MKDSGAKDAAQTTEKVTYEQWKENFKSKGYGKKKNKIRQSKRTKNKQKTKQFKKIIINKFEKKVHVHRTNMSGPKHQSLKVAWAHQRILFK